MDKQSNCVCEYCPEEYDTPCTDEHSHTNDPYSSEVALSEMWNDGIQKWHDYTTCHSTANNAVEVATGSSVPLSGAINKVAAVTDLVSAGNNLYQGEYTNAAIDVGSFVTSKFGPVASTVYGVTIGGACQASDNGTVEQASDFVPIPYDNGLNDISHKANNPTSIGNLDWLDRPQANYQDDIDWQNAPEQQEARENFYDNFNRPYSNDLDNHTEQQETEKNDNIEEHNHSVSDDNVIDNEQSHLINEHNHHGNTLHELNEQNDLDNSLSSHSFNISDDSDLIATKVSDDPVMLIQNESGDWETITASEYNNLLPNLNDEFDNVKQEISTELNQLQQELNHQIDDIGMDISKHNSIISNEYNNELLNDDDIEHTSNQSILDNNTMFDNEQGSDIFAKVSDSPIMPIEEYQENSKILTFEEWLKENPQDLTDDPLFVNIEDDIGNKYAEKDDIDETDWLF